MRPQFCCIAASRYGHLVAAADREKTVHVWDIAQRKRLRTFETTFDGGMGRLAVDEAGRYCAVGNFQEHGVALYSLETGEEIWRRSEIHEVQTVEFSPSGQEIACAVEAGAVIILDVPTGYMTSILSDYRDVYYGEDDGSMLLREPHIFVYENIHVSDKYDNSLNESRITVKLRGELAFKISPQSSGVLSACFADSRLCFSEVGGPTRCFDLNSGKELWRFAASDSEHVVLIGFDKRRNHFVGLLRNFGQRGWLRLLHFGEASSAVQDLGEVPKAGIADAFILDGSVLLTADAVLHDTASGEVIGAMEPI